MRVLRGKGRCATQSEHAALKVDVARLQAAREESLIMSLDIVLIRMTLAEAQGVIFALISTPLTTPMISIARSFVPRRMGVSQAMKYREIAVAAVRSVAVIENGS